jgi:hypothetical protein
MTLPCVLIDQVIDHFGGGPLDRRFVALPCAARLRGSDSAKVIDQVIDH